MNLYIMRHAEAQEGDREAIDRALTPNGVKQAKAVAEFFDLVDIKLDLIITSQMNRAQQTAEAFDEDIPRKITPQLAPDAMAEKAWQTINKLADGKDEVLVVTHGPLIHFLLAVPCFQFDPDKEWIHHGSVVKLNMADTEGQYFRWKLSAKLCGKIVGIDTKHVNLTEELLKLTDVFEFLSRESLAIPDRRVVIDPLVVKLQKGLRIRWNSQLKNLEEKGLPHLKDSLDQRATLPSNAVAPHGEKAAALATIPMRHKQFAVKFRKATNAAYDAGADRVSEQLPVPSLQRAKQEVTEAKPLKRKLPGPTREPEELEDELDDTTQDRVGNVIDQAFKEGLTYAATVGLVRSTFQGWSEADEGETSRAETVALAEVSGAYHDGGRDVAREYPGEVEKLWETENDPCEECQANADMDWIPDDAPFDSGDSEPPAHPNCRCSVSYRIAEPEEES